MHFVVARLMDMSVNPQRGSSTQVAEVDLHPRFVHFNCKFATNAVAVRTHHGRAEFVQDLERRLVAFKAKLTLECRSPSCMTCNHALKSETASTGLLCEWAYFQQKPNQSPRPRGAAYPAPMATQIPPPVATSNSST